MRRATKSALLALSIPTDVIDKIADNRHTLRNLRSFSRTQLLDHYTEHEAKLIEHKVKRQPIEQDVLEGIIAASNGVCSYCADGNTTRPYQIHHINPYAASQDNSEDNLLLVCPTHHAWIHDTAAPGGSQKRKRREWFALVDLARAYAARGIVFPYGIFEPVEYEGAASIVETLSGLPLSPVTAVLLSRHPLGNEACQRLRDSNFVLLVGGSGTGKSMLALGVAGMLSKDNTKVVLYRRPPSIDTRLALTEILTFIGTAAKPCILILDDANSWATATDLERVASAATDVACVIATWTGGRLEDNPTAELHVLPSRLPVRWDDLRDALFTSLLEHEVEVLEALRPIRTDDTISIGIGSFGKGLNWLLSRYSENARSIWQFLYLLRSGWKSVQDDLNMLVADDHAHVPVLYAAIEQIADVERPVTAEEACQATVQVHAEETWPAPDTKWVATIFDRLVERRLMIKVRHAYTTVHRDWSRALICCALADSRTREVTTQLLQRDFCPNASSPRRLVILWSWLWYDQHGGTFVNEWASKQSAAYWANLIGSAVSKGLIDVAMVAKRLHLLFREDQWTVVVGDALEAHESAIAGLVSAATAEDWYWLEELFMGLNHARPNCAARMIELWSPRKVASILSETHPDHYDSVSWFLSGVRRHSDEWCTEVGQNLDWDIMAENLKDVRRGDIERVEDFATIMGHLNVQLLRSRVHKLATAMAMALRGAQLSEIQFDSIPGPMWLELFPSEMLTVVEVLDPKRLACEVSIATPRYWGRLLLLSTFARRAGSDFGKLLVDSLDDRFIHNVERYGASNAHEVRVLLWQLTYGSSARRQELAAQLLPVVKTALETTINEKEEILKAYAALDLEHATRLASELNCTLPESVDVQAGNQPLLESLENGSQVRQELDELDRAEVDYDVIAFLNRDARNASDRSEPPD